MRKEEWKGYFVSAFCYSLCSTIFSFLCYCVVVFFPAILYSCLGELMRFVRLDSVHSLSCPLCAVWWMVDGESDLVVWGWNRTKGKHKLLFMRCQNAYWKWSYCFWVDRLILMGMTMARAQPPNHPTIQTNRRDVDTIKKEKHEYTKNKMCKYNRLNNRQPSKNIQKNIVSTNVFSHLTVRRFSSPVTYTRSCVRLSYLVFCASAIFPETMQYKRRWFPSPTNIFI